MTDLTIQAESTFTPTITWYTDSTKETSYNLTGYTAAMYIKASAGDSDDEALITLSTETSGITLTEEDGQLDIVLTDEQAATLTKSIYYYALRVESSGGVVTTLLKGRLLKE